MLIEMVIALFVGVLILIAALAAFIFRRMVPTNEVHIVQSAKKTTSFGKDTNNGNTYFEWPSWIPLIGVSKMILPVSNFDVDLDAYEAYDKGRLPFIVDVKAFFRIKDSNIAAQRVSSFAELSNQLRAIVQGAVRSILAGHDIEDIMQGRSTFGDAFTSEIKDQLVNWGVETIKNIELMDIKDAEGSQVIHNIMEKKKSFIQMESRVAVADNNKKAKNAETEADKEAELIRQNALKEIGIQTLETDRKIALSKQTMLQEVKEQEKVTKIKEMAIVETERVKGAEIQKQTQVIFAEQEKQMTVIKAEGQLEAKKREADGINAEGTAKAAAEKAMLLAPVEAQTTLAKEIGQNKEYQTYLITVEQIKAAQAVGTEQAKALSGADIKVITNSSTPSDGITNVMDLFSSKGGTQVGAMLEALSNTDTGKSLLKKVGVNGTNTPTNPTH